MLTPKYIIKSKMILLLRFKPHTRHFVFVCLFVFYLFFIFLKKKEKKRSRLTNLTSQFSFLFFFCEVGDE